MDKLTDLLDRANKEIKKRLEGKRSLVKNVTSPTTLERFYQCPYRAFIEHGLKIKSREEGKVDAISVGNLMHDVFKTNSSVRIPCLGLEQIARTFCLSARCI